MRNKLKTVYQQNRIQKLEKSLKDLEQENKAILKENEMLKEINESLYKNIEDIKKEHDNALIEYKNSIKDICDLKKQYKELIDYATKLKNEYNDKMKVLLLKLRS